MTNEKFPVPGTEDPSAPVAWEGRVLDVVEVTDKETHPGVRGFSLLPRFVDGCEVTEYRGGRPGSPVRSFRVRPAAGSRPEDGFVSAPAYGRTGKPDPDQVVATEMGGDGTLVRVTEGGERFIDDRLYPAISAEEDATTEELPKESKGLRERIRAGIKELIEAIL